jgi:diguanylate cyclase (GGDEF)-like protein
MFTTIYARPFFNGYAAVCLGIAAAKIHCDASSEPMPARRVLVTLLAAVGILCIITAVEFATDRFDFIDPVETFFVIIIFKFVLTLFVVILATERTNQELEELTITDPLTRIYNRRFFFDNVPNELQTGDALILFDIDHFKRINDNHGHPFGDRVLICVAQHLAALRRRRDIFVRFGGEEFVMFLPTVGETVARDIAERFCAAVANLVFSDDSGDIKVTISGGLSVCRTDREPLDRLLRDADDALYSAKETGRNRICLFTAGPKDNSRTFPAQSRS